MGSSMDEYMDDYHNAEGKGSKDKYDFDHAGAGFGSLNIPNYTSLTPKDIQTKKNKKSTEELLVELIEEVKKINENWLRVLREIKEEKDSE